MRVMLVPLMVCALELHAACARQEPEVKQQADVPQQDPVKAQSTTTALKGFVRDTSGALLPGVDVELRSLEEKTFVRNATSDARGEFSFAGVPLGACRLTFKLSGFKTYVLDVLADVAQSATIEPLMEVEGIPR